MLPPRTSPTAKTPGRLVSSRYGGRVSGQFAAVRSSCDRSGPVLMNPLSSSATQPSSHAGVRHGAGHHEHVPDVVRLDGAVSVVAPPDALEMPFAFERDDLRVRPQRDRGVVLDAANEVARHRVGQPVRREPACARAWRVCARNTAAWPAELPPPTTMTSSPTHSCASIGVARVVDARAFELREVRRAPACGTRRRSR